MFIEMISFEKAFKTVAERGLHYYANNIGNLLLIELQVDSFLTLVLLIIL